MQSTAQVKHQQKVDRAKRELEDSNGIIKSDKIVEWALLEISEKLTAIHFALMQANIDRARFGASRKP